MSWLPMSTAPRDGTVILVTELNLSTGEGYVFPAAYINSNGSGGTMIGFWAVAPTSRVPTHLINTHQDAADAVGLPVGWRSIAMTPLCWMPLPQPESVGKLRRRQGQILHHKFKSKVEA